ncbi:MAG: hypothetical protein WD342_04925 [Verrucomicrobiales bacterium]
MALLLWSLAVHHDAWLGLLNLDHHHDHHTAAEHSRSHQHGGHSHHGEDDHDHRDSVPLPDTHTEPVVPNVAKVAPDGPNQVPGNSPWFLAAVGFLLSGSFDSEIEYPPRLLDSDLDSPALILLAHSVQSNAPPVLS